MAELVARWVRFYTRDLPGPIAKRRIDEIDADLHDHTAHERARGTSDRRIALSILSRMVRGLSADTSWRGRHAEAITAYRSVRGVALATALILSVPLLAMQFTDEVAWGVVDFVVAGALLGGTGLIHQLAGRKAGTLGLNGLFVALFIGSAWLFRHAARKQPTADAGHD